LIKRASIVVVGTEILRGLVQEVNSHWLVKKLAEIGLDVARVVIVPDDYGAIAWALESSIEVSDVVLVTGGLGFTEDDITLDAAARALNLKLVLNAEAVELLKKRVGERFQGYIKAAYIPEGGRPLYNSVGISPGVHLSIDGGNKDIFFLPGVPVEMVRMFEEHVEPILRNKYARYTARISVVTEHSKESDVDSLIADIKKKYREAYFKTHASVPVAVSILVPAHSQSELKQKVESIVNELKRLVKVRSIEVQT